MITIQDYPIWKLPNVIALYKSGFLLHVLLCWLWPNDFCMVLYPHRKIKESMGNSLVKLNFFFHNMAQKKLAPSPVKTASPSTNIQEAVIQKYGGKGKDVVRLPFESYPTIRDSLLYLAKQKRTLLVSCSKKRRKHKGRYN